MTLLSTARSAAKALEQTVVRLDAALQSLRNEQREEVLGLLAPSEEDSAKAREACESLREWLDGLATDKRAVPSLPMPGIELAVDDRHPGFPR